MLSRNPITISLEQERLRNSVEKWEKCTKNSSKNCTGHRVWKKAMKKPARNRSLKKRALKWLLLLCMLEDGWLWEILPMTATTPTTAQVNDAFLLLPDPYHCRCHRSYICHSDFTFKSTAQRLDIHHIGGELSLHHTANGLFNWQHWVHLQKSWQNCIQESVVGFCWSKYISSCKPRLPKQYANDFFLRQLAMNRIHLLFQFPR